MSYAILFVLLSIALTLYIWLFGIVGDFIADRCRRFSLRDLFAVMTVAAVLIGIVVAGVSAIRIPPTR